MAMRPRQIQIHAARRNRTGEKSSHARGYTSEYRRVRREFMQANPWCIFCGAAAEEIDHIVPVSRDRSLVTARSNMRSVCRACHHRLSANLALTGQNKMR